MALLVQVGWLELACLSELGTRLVGLDPRVTLIHHPEPRVVNARFGFETAAQRFASATFSEKFALLLQLPSRLVRSWNPPEVHLASGSLP